MRRKLIVLVVMLCFWLSAAADNATINETSASTPAVNSFNSSSSANDSGVTLFAVSSSSASFSPVVMETSSALSSLTSSSSSSSSPSSSIDMASSSTPAISTPASSAPLPTSQKAPVSGAIEPSPTAKKSGINTDPTYLPMVAAVISGCGLLVVMVILLVAMAMVYRHIGKKEPMMTPLRKAKKADGGLYAVQESQSAQYLVSSVSTPSFGNSPSDVRLDAHVPSSPSNMVYYNRGMDVDTRPAGAYDPEDGYRPIQIVADVPGRPRSTTKV